MGYPEWQKEIREAKQAVADAAADAAAKQLRFDDDDDAASNDGQARSQGA